MLIFKVIRAAVSPLRQFAAIQTLLSNMFIFGKLSLNPNTRSYWNRKLSKLDFTWRDENYHHIIDIFPKDVSFSLLDVGCALGDGCELLQSHFPRAKITGADISTVGIEKAKLKTRLVEYLVLDILKDPLPSTYDYITIVETLEHFDNPFPIVEKCLGHVRDAVIISVPYKESDRYGKGGGGRKLTFSEHRFIFDEYTFDGYCCEVVRVTDFVKVTGTRCIVYKITPDANSAVFHSPTGS